MKSALGCPSQILHALLRQTDLVIIQIKSQNLNEVEIKPFFVNKTKKNLSLKKHFSDLPKHSFLYTDFESIPYFHRICLALQQ
jgi:hypothetical protein